MEMIAVAHERFECQLFDGSKKFGIAAIERELKSYGLVWFD